LSCRWRRRIENQAFSIDGKSATTPFKVDHQRRPRMQHWRHPQRRLRRPFLLHQGRPPPLHTRQRPWRRPPPRPTAHITEGVWWPATPARMGAGTDGRTGEGEAQAQHCKTGSSARRDARRRWGGWAAVGASQEARRGLGRTGGGGSAP